MRAEVVDGDLLFQDVEVIVNAWNRNILPWWMLLPQGVSKAIKNAAGLEPFRELARLPMIPTGGAVFTSAGNLSFRGIIHVAGINLLWRASECSIRTSVKSALKIMQQKKFTTIGFPAIGAGTGAMSEERSVDTIVQAVNEFKHYGIATVVRFKAMNARS